MNKQPLVSFILLSYNQEKYIKEAVIGALKQTYEPLEIIFSDDCSIDATYEIIEKEVSGYSGAHKIIMNRNPKNMGIAGNINEAISKSTGDFIIMAAGDDISLPDRTTLLVNRWKDKKTPVDLVCSYFQEMEENGAITDYVKKNVVFIPKIEQSVRNWCCGATGACAGYSRKLFVKYGPLDSRIISEDWVLSFRAWAESGIGLIERPLVLHRKHNDCLSMIHKTNRNKTPQERRNTRYKIIGDALARTIDWLKVWELTSEKRNKRIETELKNHIKLLELEWNAYASGRFKALKASALAFSITGGLKIGSRIFVRNFLRIN